MIWNCLRWGKYLADAKVPSPGDDFLNHGFACYDLYETLDGRYMALGVLEPQFWKAFCAAMGHEEWDLPGYFEPGPHQESPRKDIASVFRQKTQAWWIEHFADKDCCCEPVRDLAEVMDDPDVIAHQMAVEMVHESWGAYRQLGIAPKFSKTPGAIRSHAPELGEHTGAVLQELGYSPRQIEMLRSEGVV